MTTAEPREMAELATGEGPKVGRLGRDWTNILFLTLTPLASVVFGTWYAVTRGVTLVDVGLLVSFYVLTVMSISVGYHRFFAHRSYDCKPWHELFWLLVGAATFQNSALRWSRDHRIHHRWVDTEADPYNIKRGLFWAHMGWIFYRNERDLDFGLVPDLVKDRLVMWQHRNYLWIAVAMGFVLPMAVGAMFGSALGGLLWGGLVRIVLVHHATFAINSLAHHFGTQPYTDQESARDSWWVALITNGEGYHNFHHRFPTDYRNGCRWHHWDPGKWWIATMHRLGVVTRVSRHSEAHILRVRLENDMRRVRRENDHVERLHWQNIEARLQHFRAEVLRLAERLEEAHLRLKARTAVAASELRADRQRIKAELAEVQRQLAAAWRAWTEAVANPLVLAPA